MYVRGGAVRTKTHAQTPWDTTIGAIRVASCKEKKNRIKGYTDYRCGIMILDGKAKFNRTFPSLGVSGRTRMILVDVNIEDWRTTMCRTRRGLRGEYQTREDSVGSLKCCCPSRRRFLLEAGKVSYTHISNLVRFFVACKGPRE